MAVNAKTRAAAELELRRRQERERLAPYFDWYGDECSCGVPLGECKTHHRARPSQRPPGSHRSSVETTDWSVWFVLAGRGFGKMLAVETPIPTPSGWTTMGQLEIGSEVFDESGNPCRVTWCSPIEVPERAYRLRFSDGSTIDACSEHQWVTWTSAERKAFLRSPYEDTRQFPTNWPQWRLRRRLGSAKISESLIVEALRLSAVGYSARKIAPMLGVNHVSLAAHLRAGEYLPKVAVVHHDSPGPRIRTTEEIVRTLHHGTRGDTNHCVPNCGPLNLPDAILPVPPYTLGAWLGDGNTDSGTFTAHQDDMPHLRRMLLDDGYESVPSEADPQRLGTRGLYRDLRLAGLLGDKHVPAVYLRASFSQRLALLRGLMDTDGGNEGASTVSFVNTNKRIADAAYELVVSLGMRASYSSRPAKLYGVEHGTAYQVTFTPTLRAFTLPRKVDRIRFDVNQTLRRYHRMIDDASKIEPGPMRCITVDSPNAMYLCGPAMIPTHNTRTGAGWIVDKVRQGARHIALVGDTVKDVRVVMIEGPGGLKSVSPPWLLPEDPDEFYQPSKAQCTWRNGATATIYSAEQPDQLRGPQNEFAWIDELAKFKHRQQETWDNLEFGLRLGANPQAIVTTTPRPTATVKMLLSDPKTVVTGGSTYENSAHLAPSFFDRMRQKYEGTRLGRQELHAALLEDTPGALWTLEVLEACRVPRLPPGVSTVRVVVSIDPSAGSIDPESAAECGITAHALGSDGHGYLLDDASLKGTPKEWGTTAIALYQDLRADLIVAEINNGGDMVEYVLRSIDPTVNFKKLWASRGKQTRAEPVAALFEQTRYHLVGEFPELEAQMNSWVPGEKSPDRLDSAVWGATEIMLEDGSTETAFAVGPKRDRYSLTPH